MLFQYTTKFEVCKWEFGNKKKSKEYLWQKSVKTALF